MVLLFIIALFFRSLYLKTMGTFFWDTLYTYNSRDHVNDEDDDNDGILDVHDEDDDGDGILDTLDEDYWHEDL